MRNALKVFCICVLFAVTGAGCGGGTSSETQSQSGGQPPVDLQGVSPTTTVKCGSTTCDAYSQYCYQELAHDDNTGNGSYCALGLCGTVEYAACAPLPKACTDCDCAIKDAKQNHPGTCDNFTGCEDTSTVVNGQGSSAGTTVSCYVQ